jgi:hypothetical protein
MPTRIVLALPFTVTPMQPTLVARPFHVEGWLYEEKMDGLPSRSPSIRSRPQSLKVWATGRRT